MKTVKKVLAALNAKLKYHFAKYVVVDSHDTFQLCWTVKEAKQWLAYCADVAQIKIIDGNRIIYQRTQA